MPKVMLNLKGIPEGTTLEQLCSKLSVERKHFDEEFGVILVDPKDGIHTVLVEQSTMKEIPENFRDHWPDVEVEGPFSNPRIAPFGPPQEKENENEE